MAKYKKDKPEAAEKKTIKTYNSIKELQQDLNKKFGDGSIVYGTNSFNYVDAMSTGIASLDIALGCGGLPIGRIIEISGPESGGKTTTCLNIIANCQKTFFDKKKRKGVAAFIDVEHAFDPVWAANIGVDTNKLLYSQPDSGEQAFDIIEAYANSGLIDLIVVDSVAGLMSMTEIENDMSNVEIGGLARLMSKGLRKMKGPCNRTNTTIIFINQLRDKIGVMFGATEQTTGGRALRFYASVRAEVKRGDKIEDGGELVGFSTRFKVTKNKVAPPFRTAEFNIRFGTPCSGIDLISSLYEAAILTKTIVRRGSHNYFTSKQGTEMSLGNGTNVAIDYLRRNNEVMTEVNERVYNSIIESYKSIKFELESDDELDDPVLDGNHEQSQL